MVARTSASGDILQRGGKATMEIETAFTHCQRSRCSWYYLDPTSCSRRLGVARLLKIRVVLPLPAMSTSGDERVAL